MTSLPEAIWHRRLKSEAELMSKSEFTYSVNDKLTEYLVTLNADGLKLSNGQITKQKIHQVKITLNREYPYPAGLEVTWMTQIFHPNIREEDGKVCIHLLNAWSADITVLSLCRGIKQLLENPNPLDPLNKPAADYYIENPKVLEMDEKSIPQKEMPSRPKIIFER